MTDAAAVARRRPVTALLAVLLYSTAVFSLAPLLSVLLYHVIETLHMQPPPLHELTADCLKLVALLALWPLARACGLRGRRAAGLDCGGAGPRRLGLGLAFGLLTMLLVASLLLMSGARVPRADLAALLLPALLKATVTAVLVACIEEVWFRGVLQQVLMPLGLRVALPLVATLYALAHFLRPDLIVAEPRVWYDGFVALGGMFSRMTDPASLDSLAALLVAGLVLGWLRWRDGCVAAAIGCHAGWVLGIQFTRRVSTTGEQSWMSGQYDGVIGWLFLAVVAAAALTLFRQRRPAMR